jgi:hypothetical protein
MRKFGLRAVAALFTLAFLSAPLTCVGQLDNSDNLADRLKKACRTTKRNCEVTAFVSSNGTTNGMYFIFNQDDFFAHLENQFSFVHAQGHDLIKKSGEKEFHETQPDPTLRNIVWAPLTPSVDARDDYTPGRVESLGLEDEDGEKVLHLRLVPAGQRQGDDDSLPNYWLAAVGEGNWVVRRVRAFTTLGELAVQVDARFAKIGQAPKIELDRFR